MNVIMVSTKEYNRLKEQYHEVVKENTKLKENIEKLCVKCKKIIRGEKPSFLDNFRSK